MAMVNDITQGEYLGLSFTLPTKVTGSSIPISSTVWITSICAVYPAELFKRGTSLMPSAIDTLYPVLCYTKVGLPTKEEKKIRRPKIKYTEKKSTVTTNRPQVF